MDFRLKVPENSPSYSFLLLAYDFTMFPICALSFQCETLLQGNVLPVIEGQKATETAKPDSWSAKLSKKQLD